MAIDRISVDKKRAEDIRALTKGKEYLPFDNNKDIFLYALSMGNDMYIGGVLEGGKDGFFLDKDLNPADQAFIYAVVKSELNSIEELTDKEKVYSVAEGIADKGFSMIMDEAAKYNDETLILKLLSRANELYNEEKQKGTFNL